MKLYDLFNRKTIKEFNEFTWDMVRALPKAYYFHKNGYYVKVLTKPGLSSLYYFADEVIERNRFEEQNDVTTYNNTRPHFTRKNWLPPPLKKYYEGYLSFSKPTVTIQNKFSMEWLKTPANYYSIGALSQLFSMLQKKYQIIYIRPSDKLENYFYDDNQILEFEDFQMIEDRFPDIIDINQLMKKYPQYDYNQLQFMAEATSVRHITISGGNACVSSYFEGDVIIYDNPDTMYGDRGIWKSDSWLKYLSGCSITGVGDYDELLEKVEYLWL